MESFPLRSRIATLLAGYAVLITGNGLLGTLVSLRLASPAFSAAAVGVVQSAYYLGFMLGALTAGKSIVWMGPLRAFSVFAVMVACASLGHAFFSGPVVWFVLRLVTGACLAGIFSVVESQLNAAASDQVRGRVFALYMMTTYLGVSSGQLLLNLASPTSNALFALTAVLFSASLIPILLRNSSGDPTLPSVLRPRVDLPAIVKTVLLAPLGMAGCVLAGLLNSTFYSLMPLFLQSIGLSVGQISGTLFLALLSALLFQWPMGMLSDRFNRRKVLFLVCLTIGLISLLVVRKQGAIGVTALICLYAGMVFTIYALSVTLVNDGLASERRIPASAAVLLMFSLGGCAGPILVALAATLLGRYGLFWFSVGAAWGFAALIVGVFGLNPRAPSA
jgi:MFS family permease